MWKRILSLSLGTMLLIGGVAPVGAARRGSFRQSYHEAQRLLEAGDIEAAIRTYHRAYELRHDTRVLRGLARAYAKKGDAAIALQFYDLHLRSMRHLLPDTRR